MTAGNGQTCNGKDLSLIVFNANLKVLRNWLGLLGIVMQRVVKSRLVEV